MNKKTTVYSWFLLGLAVMGLWMRGFADAVDSYVEFGGTVHVDTGYYVSGQTAIVADFQMVDTTTAQQLVWSAGNEMWNRLYVSGGIQWAWSCKDDSGNTESTGINVSGDRLVATVDGFNNRVTLVKDGV